MFLTRGMRGLAGDMGKSGWDLGTECYTQQDGGQGLPLCICSLRSFLLERCFT